MGAMLTANPTTKATLAKALRVVLSCTSPRHMEACRRYLVQVTRVLGHNANELWTLYYNVARRVQRGGELPW